MSSVANTLAAVLYTTGAVNVWVQFAGYTKPQPQSPGQYIPGQGFVPGGLQPPTIIPPSQIYYVGTCEICPQGEESSSYLPIYTSTGGLVNPSDKSYEGSSEIVVLDLNRYNAEVVDLLESAPRYGRSIDSLQNRAGVQNDSEFFGTSPTITNRLDRGSLLIGNGGYYSMWLQYINQSDVSLGPGWYYYCCSTAAVYVDRQGTRDKRRRVIVEAMELSNDSYSSWGVKTNNLDEFLDLAGLFPS